MATRYLLDTNICIYIAKENPPKVRSRFAEHVAADLAMSVVTFGELQFGAARSLASVRAIQAAQELTNRIEVVALPVAAGECFGQVRAELQRAGTPIGTNDLWIVAHALSAGWTLVTNNEREFSRIRGLKIENWAS